MNIPIRYGQQEQQQQRTEQQQQPYTSCSRQGQGWQQQEPSSYMQQGYPKQEQFKQEQFKSQEPQEYQRGFAEREQGGFGESQKGSLYGKQDVTTSGKWIEKTLREQISVADLTLLHLLVSATSICYVKEHVFMKLSNDTQGLIKNWHKEVTVKNLEHLTNVCKSWGLPLPCSKTPEQRENEIKQALPQKLNVLTELEVLKDIMCSACSLEQVFAQAFMSSCNSDLREIARMCCGNVCENFVQIKNHLNKMPEFHPIPIARTVLVKEGVYDRK
jgi:hypothetical protein